MTTRLALTPGEPAGIGPDVLIQVAQKPQAAELVAFCDPDLLLTRARQLNLPLNLKPFHPSTPPLHHPIGTLLIHAIPLHQTVIAGQGDKKNARYVLDTLTAATDACMKKTCDGLVTGPVHKGLMNEGGVLFSGHTEFLADHTGSEQVVMMLATEGLRVALATTHLPLKDVPAAITQVLLEKIITVLCRDLEYYFCTQAPKVFVCGLNPHAGDNGALGREEIEVIIPVLEKLRERSLFILGPYSADTIFSPAHLKTADVFLAMYHDQGLPVLKYRGFGNAVNITLGLNIVRTSVDHGTAFDLAGTGRSDCGSLQQAINTAVSMCQHNMARSACSR